MDAENLTEMLAQASAMREAMTRRLAEVVVEGESGGGAVAVRMSGEKKLLKVTIAPAAASAAADDLTLLEDLIVAAVNEASRKADAASESTAAGMLGSIGLPSV